MFYTYIIYSSKLDRYYIGSTADLNERLPGHNSGKTTYTRKGKPWELKYHETFGNKTEALKRELYIKSMKSRKFIEVLISSVHPD